jgi:uncharacterized membrane protein YkoI
MVEKRKLYLAAAAAVLIGGAGFAVAEKVDTQENDAQAVLKAQVSLLQAVTMAEQTANGKAARAEYEQDRSGQHYEVEIVNGAKVYDVRIDAASGKVLSSVEDRNDHHDKDDD